MTTSMRSSIRFKQRSWMSWVSSSCQPAVRKLLRHKIVGKYSRNPYRHAVHYRRLELSAHRRLHSRVSQDLRSENRCRRDYLSGLVDDDLNLNSSCLVVLTGGIRISRLRQIDSLAVEETALNRRLVVSRSFRIHRWRRCRRRGGCGRDWFRFRPGLGLGFCFRGLADFSDGDFAAADSVIRIFHAHANAKIAAVIKNEIIVCIDIGGKPELAINLFAICLDHRKLVCLRFRAGLALCLDDLQIVIVDPDSSHKNAILCFRTGHDLRRTIKYVQVELIDTFFADVFEIVEAGLGAFERKRVYAPQVVEIFISHRGPLQARHREEIDLFESIALVIESEVGYSMIFADDLTAHAQLLNQRIPLEKVFVQRLAKLGFFRGEPTNDLVDLRLAEVCGPPNRRTLGIRRSLLCGNELGGRNQQT